jgi:hypothetical protein
MVVVTQVYLVRRTRQACQESNIVKKVLLFLCTSLPLVAGGAAFADDPGTATYRLFVNDAIAQISARTGVTFTLPTVVQLTDQQEYNQYGPIWAEGIVWMTTGKTWSPDGACAIKVFPEGQKAADMQSLKMVITHEVFHCFQDQVLGSYKAWKAVPAWLGEGEAMFVGESLAPSNNAYSKLFWKNYIDNPNKHLFDRDYDAVGFYAHLDDVGVGVWHLLLPMVTHDSMTAYHMAVNEKPKEFLTTWAASWFREGPSKEWRIEGPGPVGQERPPSHLDSVANGQSVSVTAKAWENTLERVDTQGADVVRLTPVTGWGAATDVNNHLDVKLYSHSVEVCTKVGGCECPEGKTGNPPTLDAVGPLKLGVTGGETGAEITVEGRSLDDYCKDKPQSGGSWGNPCAFLDPATISSITGLHITKEKNDGDACIYVDPTAPLSPVIQQFGKALSMAFSGESPFRLQGAPNGVPEPQSGAGVIVRLPSGGGDLSKFSVHDFVQSVLAEVPAEAGCGTLHDVKGLNAASVVCLNGGIGHGGVVKNDKAVHVMYLAPGNATNDVMGRLLTAAAAHM